MKICILGGTGFIGKNLAVYLSNRGYSVVIPSRKPELAKDLKVMPKIKIIPANIHKEKVLFQVINDCEIVINAIGILNEKRGRENKFQYVHIDFLKKIVSVCRSSRISHFIHIGALKADSKLGASKYLRSKGQGERIVKDLSKNNFNYTIFQPSVVFGKEDNFINLFAKIIRLFPLIPLAGYKTRFAPIFVDDISKIIYLSINNYQSYNKTFQLCGPEIFSLKELVLRIAQTININIKVICIPKWIAYVQAFMMSYLVPGKILTVDNLKSMSIDNVCTKNGFDFFDLSNNLSSLTPTINKYLNKYDSNNKFSNLRNKKI
tara:strand:+ start:8167 stop:9123 length:957 start_codon:yes stop_codon:yes gene_type:complete